MSDPFEANITEILAQRKAVAAAILASKVAAGAPSSEPDVEERLPFNIAKTQRMLDQNEYEKAKKKAAAQKST
jgi:hypothetical protein